MKFTKLKPSATSVDHSYQREFDKRRAEIMARSYDPRLIGVPVVSLRGDGMIVRIDGQHRLAANCMAGHGDVPILMELHEGLSECEEAELFLRLNGGRKYVGAIDKYKARLVAHEPTALEIQAILKRVGCKIVRSPVRGGVLAVQQVERAFHRGNLEPTMRALYAWLEGSPEAFDGTLINAVSVFLVAYKDAEPMHLASRLDAHAPQRIIARLKREWQVSHSKEDVARLVLADIYNTKTAKTRRVGQAPVAVAAE